MKRFLPILLVCLLALGSCTKKELPEPVDGQPSIWMQCKMNGNPFEMNVGTNSTYGTSISIINNSYRQFAFKITATDINKSFQITMNNWNDTMGNIADDIEKTIKPGKYNFTYTNNFPYYYFKPNEVNISYTDNNNQVSFYSMPVYQTSNADFTIVSVKDVIEDGKKYKMAEITFSCLVQYDDGQNIWKYEVKDGHAVIPFGGY